jgi:hypothetical protein
MSSWEAGGNTSRGRSRRGSTRRGEKKRAAHSPEGGGPPNTLATRSQGIASHCSSSRRRRLDCFARGRAAKSSGFHPQAAWPRCEVRQCERCESAGSRIGLSHCTPRRYIGVDETRDWSRLPEGGDHPDRRTPEALDCVGGLPGILSAGSPHKAWQRLTGSQPFPCASNHNLGLTGNRASADVSSAYVISCGIDVEWEVERSTSVTRRFHVDVDLCKASSHSPSTRTLF